MTVSLLALIGAFRLWPEIRLKAVNTDVIYDTRGQEVIALEDILPTKQATSRPPPPRPFIPMVVPNESTLEEIEIELSDYVPLDDYGDDGEPGEIGAPQGTGTGSQTAIRADVGPRTIRFVEPEYSQEARRRGVRAEFVIEVLVNERGRVEESKIVERFLIGKDDEDKQPVAEVGYGLEEAALSAADRWVFRPARQNGRAVQSYTTLTFTFGV